MTSILEIKGDSLRIEGTVLIVSKLKVIPIVLETAGDDFFNICIQSGSITASVSRLGEFLTNNDPPAGTTYTWEQISPDPAVNDNLSLTNTDKRTVNYEILFDDFIDRTVRFYINKGQEDEQFDDVFIKGTPQSEIRNVNTKPNRDGTLSNLSTTLQFVSVKNNTSSANTLNTRPNSVGTLSNLATLVPFVSVKNNTSSANTLNVKSNLNSTFNLYNLSIVLRRIGATTTGIQGQANTVCDVNSWDLEWYHPGTGTDSGTNTASTFLNDYDLIDRWVVEEQTNGSNTWAQVLVKFPSANPIKTDLRYNGTIANRKYRVIAYYKNIEFSQRLNAFVELSGEGRFTYRVSNYVTTPSSGYITIQGKSTETADMVNSINTSVNRNGVLTNFSNTVPTSGNIGG